ncbi:MAG TPA: hypothetical protein VL137_10710, partial [Polyangiaceae bacterium]|nr:hypothetical protein [Polyangiaceae bacterium]
MQKRRALSLVALLAGLNHCGKSPSSTLPIPAGGSANASSAQGGSSGAAAVAAIGSSGSSGAGQGGSTGLAAGGAAAAGVAGSPPSAGNTSGGGDAAGGASNGGAANGGAANGGAANGGATAVGGSGPYGSDSYSGTVFYVTNADGSLYAIEEGTWQQLGMWTGLPITDGIRGIDADPVAGVIYFTHGGSGPNSNGAPTLTGSLGAWNVYTNSMVYDVALTHGVDQPSYGEGVVYVPSGEYTDDRNWYYYKAADG